jgi:hypothetical protein
MLTRILAYADVCWRKLTLYAGVWGRCASAGCDVWSTNSPDHCRVADENKETVRRNGIHLLVLDLLQVRLIYSLLALALVSLYSL